MNECKQPTKEQVRQYMVRRRQAHTPPPEIRQIRRELGWGLAASTRPRLKAR